MYVFFIDALINQIIYLNHMQGGVRFYFLGQQYDSFCCLAWLETLNCESGFNKATECQVEHPVDLFFCFDGY